MLMFCNCVVIRKVAGGNNLEHLSEHDFIVLLEEKNYYSRSRKCCPLAIYFRPLMEFRHGKAECLAG